MRIENIKFKAKRLDNGEWVEGSLIRNTAGIKERAYIVDNFSSMSDYRIVGVDPSTVCQFTGLKDCEGNELWEGDIISFSDSKNMVVWEDNLCAFVLVGVESQSYYTHCDILKNYPFYIVGNKFDKEK